MKKKIIGIVAGVVAVAVIAAGIFVYFKEEKKTYGGYRQVSEYEMNRDIDYQYTKYADGVLCYSDDGISYVSKGKEVWNHAFEMKTPVLDVCGDYVAIGNYKSNELHLYGIDGSDLTIPTKYELISVEVSNQGVVAAILEDSKANYFQVTDKDGNELVTGRTVLKGNGYPVAFSLSQDGKKMIVSYIYVSSGVTQSKVLFYNFSEIGQNSTDRMVGGFNQYTSTIVPDVEFINNTTAIAFGDNLLSFYSMKEKPNLTKEIKIEDKIKSIFYSEKYVGVVFESGDTTTAYRLVVYNASGDVVMKKKIQSDYDDLQFAGDNVLYYNDVKCQVFSFHDVERYQETFVRGVKKMIYLGGENRFARITADTIEEIKLN